MDLINGIISKISGGGSSSSYEKASVNRITLFTMGRYFLYNFYYGDAVNTIPPPVLGNGFNCYTYFSSNTENSATINWGDGSEEEVYEFSKTSSGGYILGFRSLNCEFRKAPGSTFGVTLSNGRAWLPEPPRDYGSPGHRKVVITFENEISTFNCDVCKWSEYPLIEAPSIRSISTSDIGTSTVPLNRFAGMKNLTYLNITYASSRMSQFPESFKDCEKLGTFTANGVFNFSNLENSGLREILKQMTSLYSLDLSACYLKKYIKEFNDLPNLQTLYFGQTGLLPDFSEVDKINPNIRVIRTGSTWGAVSSSRLEGDPTGWMDWYNGKGMENIRTIFTYGNDSYMDLEYLPQWLYEARSLTNLSMSSAFKITTTTDYIDTFINTMYQETIKHPMSSTDTDGKRNQWYGLKIPIYDGTYNTGIRPSGSYQATSGFVKGKANGNPSSGMEKIYVLQQNYGQVWTVKPA